MVLIAVAMFSRAKSRMGWQLWGMIRSCPWLVGSLPVSSMMLSHSFMSSQLASSPNGAAPPPLGSTFNRWSVAAHHRWATLNATGQPRFYRGLSDH